MSSRRTAAKIGVKSQDAQPIEPIPKIACSTASSNRYSDKYLRDSFLFVFALMVLEKATRWHWLFIAGK